MQSNPTYKEKKQRKGTDRPLKETPAGRYHLCGILDSFVLWIYRAIVLGWIGRFFSAYSAEERFFGRMFGKNRESKVGRARSQPTGTLHGQTFARITERIFLMRPLAKIRKWFLCSPVSILEGTILSYALVSFFANFLRLVYLQYETHGEEEGFYWLLCISDAWKEYFLSPVAWVTLGILLVVPIAFSFFRRATFSQVGHGSLIFSWLLYGVFGIRQEVAPEDSMSHTGVVSLFCCLISAGCGVYSAFRSPVSLLLGILAILLAFTVLNTPESGIIGIILAFPFLGFSGQFDRLFSSGATFEADSSLTKSIGLPVTVLIGMLFLIYLAYLLKWIRKKRIFRFGLIDFAVILSGTVILIYGFYPLSDRAVRTEAVLSALILLLYFPIVNLIASGEWLSRFVYAMQISLFITLTYGLWIRFAGFPLLSLSPVFALSGETVLGDIGFGQNEIFGAYLILMLPFSLTAIRTAHTRFGKAWNLLILLEVLLTAVLTWDVGVWLAMLVTLTIYFVLYSYRTLYIAPLTFLTGFTVGKLIGGNRALSLGSHSLWNLLRDKAVLWAISWENLDGQYAVGHGYGLLAYRIATGEPDPGSDFLRLLFSVGIPGLSVFYLTFFLFSQMCFEQLKNGNQKCFKTGISSGLCAMIGIVFFGCYASALWDFRILLSFVLIFAVTVSYARASETERVLCIAEENQPSDARHVDYTIYEDAGR